MCFQIVRLIYFMYNPSNSTHPPWLPSPPATLHSNFHKGRTLLRGLDFRQISFPEVIISLISFLRFFFQGSISKFVMLHAVFCLLKAIILVINLYVWDENMHISFIKYSIKIGPQSSEMHSKVWW